MYENTILEHYASVASSEGHLESCTMHDEAIRAIETQFILNEIRKYQKQYVLETNNKRYKVLDVGCGNGFTLTEISRNFSDLELSGIEFTPELRSLANKKGLPFVIESGDIRDKTTIPSGQNFLISQRVVINLLDKQDQVNAVSNLIDSTVKGGHLLFIEAFSSGLENLNKCRTELALSEIPPAHHNLYLEDSFFDQFESIKKVETELGDNVLSTHYFISRVLHDVALSATNGEFVRNSLFTQFFDEALPLGIGNFSPLKCLVFQKK